MKAESVTRAAVALMCFGAALTMAFAQGIQAPAILVVPQNLDPTQQSLTINFHNQVVSTQSAAQTVTLWNISSTTVTNLKASVTSGQPFAISSGLSATSLAAGQSATVKVKFFAQSTGGPTFTSTLSFTGTATGLIPIPSVVLTGTRASSSSAALSVNPAYGFHGIGGLNGNSNLDGNLYFGNQSFDQNASVTTCAAKVYLSNGTNSTINSTTASLSGSSAFALSVAPPSSVLTGVDTASLGVTYTPGMANGNDTATLTVTFGTTGTQSLSLFGNGSTTSAPTNHVPFIDMGNNNLYTPASTGYHGGLFDGNFGPNGDTGCNSPTSYINSSNPTGASQDTIGRAFAALIQPLNSSGVYDGTGKAVLLSLGMSNASDEWCGIGSALGNTGRNFCGSPNYTGTAPSQYSFMQEALHHSLNSSLVIVNGAISSQEACDYTVTSGTTPPSLCAPFESEGGTINDYDAIKTDQFTSQSLLYEGQVQAIWLKEADVVVLQQQGQSHIGPLAGCSGCTEADAYNLETNLGKIVRAAKQRYPNLRMVFLTSRSYGGFTNFGPTKEPYAYEGGFANKWLVKAQIDQMNGGGCVIDTTYAQDLNYLYTPTSTPPCTSSVAPEAPWIIWDRLPSTEPLAGSTYIWAYTPQSGGTSDPNSDGAIWPFTLNATCTVGMTNTYFVNDGQHPNDCGIYQVGGNLLLNYFLNSPYTNPWFSSH